MRQKFHHAAKNVVGGVARYFDHVLARIGVRSAEKRDQHFVYNGFAVANRSVVDRISFLRRQGLSLYASEQRVADRHGPFSADPDQRDGAACTRRDGGNRLVPLVSHLPM